MASASAVEIINLRFGLLHITPVPNSFYSIQKASATTSPLQRVHQINSTGTGFFSISLPPHHDRYRCLNSYVINLPRSFSKTQNWLLGLAVKAQIIDPYTLKHKRIRNIRKSRPNSPQPQFQPRSNFAWRVVLAEFKRPYRGIFIPTYIVTDITL